MKYVYQNREIFPTVEIYHDVIPYLAGISMRDFYLDAEKCAYSWEIGNQKLYDFFGDELPLRVPTPGPISYGHLVCLGAPIEFPEDGEPNVKPFAASIDEAIAIVKAKKGMDFSAVPLFQSYYKTWQYLMKRLPNALNRFSGFGGQGPITTALLMRGQELLCDLYDEPEKAAQFIDLITDSLIDFNRFLRRLNGESETEGWGFCDDFASLVTPSLWPKFVLPAFRKYFDQLCQGDSKFLHVENLTPAHLPYLNQCGLKHYQPSVSDHITSADIKAHMDPSITFDLLLYAYRITEMSDEQIKAWVDQALADGVCKVRTQLGTFTVKQNKLDRIKAFYRAFDRYRAD